MVDSLIERSRKTAGAIVFDVPRYLRDVVWLGQWPRFHNRHEKVEFSPDRSALRILDHVSSAIYLSQLWPGFGRHLMRTALKQWPITIAEQVSFSETPQLTFIIPHRGTERRALLEATVRSIAASEGVDIECIVVEQGAQRVLESLPGNTRLIHVPASGMEDPWHKTLAYNVGAAHARSQYLICHDGDILVPREYARQMHRLLSESAHPVAFCQRFLFYMDEPGTQQLLARGLPAEIRSETLVEVRQNWVGGTLGISRAAFEDIGGFDEDFVGWTGEDVEFHDRCLELPGWFYGFVPFVHLWHPPQREKGGVERAAQIAFTQKKLSIPRGERIACCRSRLTETWRR